MTDTSKDAVERLADELPETNWGAPRLYRAADTFRAMLAEREALTAEVARLTAALETERAVVDALAASLAYMVNNAEWREQNESVFWEATKVSREALAAHAARREGGV